MSWPLKNWIPDGAIDRFLVLGALVGLLASGYQLFFRQMSWEGSRGSAPIAYLKTEDAVRRRPARSLYWGNIGNDEALYPRDTLYTPAGIYARIVFENNKVVEFEPDSMVQLDEISSDKLQITLLSGTIGGEAVKKGEATVRRVVMPVFRLPYPKPSKQEMLIDPSLIETRQASLEERVRQFFTRAPQRLPLQALSSVQRGPLSQKMRKANEPRLDRVSDYQLQLLTPAKERYNLKANPWLRFSWTEVPLSGVEYEIEVSPDPFFNEALSHRTTRSAVELQFEDEGNYWWRVTAYLGEEKAASPLSYFSLTNKGRIAAPQPSESEQSSVSGFIAILASDPSFQRPFANYIVGKPQCPRKGLKPGRYYCRIQSAKDRGFVQDYLLTVR